MNSFWKRKKWAHQHFWDGINFSLLSVFAKEDCKSQAVVIQGLMFHVGWQNPEIMLSFLNYE